MDNIIHNRYAKKSPSDNRIGITVLNDKETDETFYLSFLKELNVFILYIEGHIMIIHT